MSNTVHEIRPANDVDQILRTINGERIGEADKQLLVNLAKSLAEKEVERDVLCEHVTKLRAELMQAKQAIEELRKEKAALELERDAYLQSLHALLPHEAPASEEEWLEIQKEAIPFEEVMKEVHKLRGS